MSQGQLKPGRTSENRYVAVAGAGVGLTIFLVLIGGYFWGWDWTGFGERTFWDWLNLLIVPAVLALGGYLFTRSENRRAQEIARQRARDDRDIADQRARDDREIAEQQRQDDVLQAYLNQMGHLLLDKERPLRGADQDVAARTLARARTLTILSRLDGERKGTLVQFLYEADLIRTAEDVDEDLFELEIAFAAGAYPIEEEEDETPKKAKSGQPAAVSIVAPTCAMLTCTAPF